MLLKSILSQSTRYTVSGDFYFKIGENVHWATYLHINISHKQLQFRIVKNIVL